MFLSSSEFILAMMCAGRRRPIQRAHDGGIGHRVVLDDHVRRLAGLDVGHLAVEQLHEPRPQADRRHQHLVEIGALRIASEVVEDL
jgi:hypothetical protein